MTTANAARPTRVLWALLVLIGVLYAVYAQTRAFAWDEGWHLVAAQNINRGLLPYLNFIYSQTPLNAFWNAGWLRIAGDTWRTPHAVAAVMTTLAVLMIAGYALRRFPVPDWRVPAAITAVSLFGLDVMVVEFGTIAQAYALCLFFIAGAFLATVEAVQRETVWLAGAAGLLSSAAANCSLLTAPVAAVLLLWLLICNQAGSRWAKLGAFAAACTIPSIPLAWLFVQGPRQAIFNVLHYNLLYRQRDWKGAWSHNFGEWFAWIGSPQALTLAFLSVAGLLFVRKRSGWERAARREFYLCGWLAIALLAHISTAVPTFRRYYLFSVPFLAILSCAGLYDVGSRLGSPGRPWTPVLIVCLLTGTCLTKRLIEAAGDFSWYTVERIAAKVKAVTPPKAVLFADEPVYFVMRHAPPPGLELVDSHKLSFPPAVARELHVVPEAELDRQLKARVFDVIEISDDDTRIDDLGLAKLYAHCAEVEDYDIFWGK